MVRTWLRHRICGAVFIGLINSRASSDLDLTVFGGGFNSGRQKVGRGSVAVAAAPLGEQPLSSPSRVTTHRVFLPEKAQTGRVGSRPPRGRPKSTSRFPMGARRGRPRGRRAGGTNCAGNRQHPRPSRPPSGRCSCMVQRNISTQSHLLALPKKGGKPPKVQENSEKCVRYMIYLSIYR